MGNIGSGAVEATDTGLHNTRMWHAGSYRSAWLDAEGGRKEKSVDLDRGQPLLALSTCDTERHPDPLPPMAFDCESGSVTLPMKEA